MHNTPQSTFGQYRERIVTRRLHGFLVCNVRLLIKCTFGVEGPDFLLAGFVRDDVECLLVSDKRGDNLQ